MTLDELAVTVKDLQGQVAALQKEKQALQQKVNLLEDTENIKKLQRAYGFTWNTGCLKIGGLFCGW
jgi:cell division protein FtsB